MRSDASPAELDAAADAVECRGNFLGPSVESIGQVVSLEQGAEPHRQDRRYLAGQRGHDRLVSAQRVELRRRNIGPSLDRGEARGDAAERQSARQARCPGEPGGA